MLALLAAAGTARADAASAVTAGASHTCARTLGGSVQCWGANGDGQLGNGTTANSSVAVAVTGMPSGIAAIAAGGRHTCALTGGDLSCWGYNQHGQLGNGTTTNSSIPVAVGSLSSGVVAVAAGAYHACALDTEGGVSCWGMNTNGQLGSESTTISSNPLAVTGLSSGVAAIAAGGFHTCALGTSGEVQCWGLNEDGQLGNGTTANSNVPVAVTGLSNAVAAITAGAYHTCALGTNGGVECWGFNYSGQLGNGTTGNSSIPVAVTGLMSGVAAIAAGDYHACGLGSDGGILCWGLNDSGQLGNGTTRNSSIPVAVTGLTSSMAAVDAGRFHTCAVATGGAVKCWGNNFAGQLGNGTTINSSVPVDVSVPIPALETPALSLLAAAIGFVGVCSLGRKVRLRAR